MDNYNNLLIHECPPDLRSPESENEQLSKTVSSSTTGSGRTGPCTKGMAMSFGFKRRPTTAPSYIADNATATRRLAKQDLIDRNGNGGNTGADTECLTGNAIPPGRTTPRLAPPRKQEASATRVSRFGFRQPNANRLNKVADINISQLEYRNNNTPTTGFRPATSLTLTRTNAVLVDTNDNRTTKFGYMPQVNRYTLQSTHLPKAQPVKMIETKTAKTLANNNRKALRKLHTDGISSKEGSVTEDSGVGSNSSAGNAETDTLQGLELLDSSPTTPSRNLLKKNRQLEMVITGKGFDERDLDDSVEPAVPLPRLPSVFQNFNSGFVRERRLEYEKHVERARRKISITSSEGFIDDYVDDEHKVRRTENTEKIFSTSPPKVCRKKAPEKILRSPTNSDEHDWMHAGEAMADDVSYSFSSSDESKCKAKPTSLNVKTVKTPVCEIKNVLLTIEDPKFAAVAAASTIGTLLEDETSPVDSLLCSYSESENLFKTKLNEKKMGSFSDSKDINEKLTLSPSSPGTPTNASNSLSLSDGKDYFDDEIADQPALVFDDNVTTSERQNSENTPTLIDSTAKPKRKPLPALERSPLMLRKRGMLNSRTASVDTLSPCESIASDDLMMDYEQSQSSGIEDTLERNDNHSNGFNSLDDTLKNEQNKKNDLLHEWVASVGHNCTIGLPKSVTRSSRLLRSRASTPCSVPDSPNSLDSRINSKTNHSITRSPLRAARLPTGSPAGYDSDDSIKIDRASHGAMVQDIVQMKTMLIKLKRVLNESEALNPFDNQTTLKNGLFNGLSSEGTFMESISIDDSVNVRMEMADLRRQVLFLQGQLEDREQSLQELHERMHNLVIETESAKSAPASTISLEISTTNAATQTERVRPISAGPSLLQVSSTDANVGSLVSVNETRRSRNYFQTDVHSQYKKTTPKLWRRPGEPAPTKLSSSNSSSSIPRRSSSQARTLIIPS